MKPHDIFEANDLFENTNHTQVQSTLIALASQVRPGSGLGGGGSLWGTRGIPSSFEVSPFPPCSRRGRSVSCPPPQGLE